MIDIKDLMIGNYLYVAGLQGHKFCMRVQVVDYRKNKVLMDGDTKGFLLLPRCCWRVILRRRTLLTG